MRAKGEGVLEPTKPRGTILNIPAALGAQVNLPLPSGPRSTKFSSGIQAGQTITGNSLFLNFISTPQEKWEPEVRGLGVCLITIIERTHGHG